jgi:hypothetical protein
LEVLEEDLVDLTLVVLVVVLVMVDLEHFLSQHHQVIEDGKHLLEL